MINEKVHFRLITCPDCNHQMCWVNPRLPSFCPECGSRIYSHLLANPSRILVSDDNATLCYHA